MPKPANYCMAVKQFYFRYCKINASFFRLERENPKTI